jgi:hypothetical protein
MGCFLAALNRSRRGGTSIRAGRFFLKADVPHQKPAFARTRFMAALVSAHDHHER